MFELILYNLSSSWFLLVMFLLMLFIIGCIIYTLTKQFNLKNGKIKLYGMFLGISNTDIFILSTIIVKTFLIIFFISTYQENILMSLVMIAIISIIYIVFNLRNVLYEIINAIALMATTYFVHILNTYIIEISRTDAVGIVRNALMVFAIMYTIYISLRNFEDIITNNENINE